MIYALFKMRNEEKYDMFILLYKNILISLSKWIKFPVILF